MKNLFLLLCVLSSLLTVQASDKVVYGNDFEIIHSYAEEESFSMGSNRVILDGDSIEASIQMTSGPSCLFEGVLEEGNTYRPTQELMKYGESCRVTLGHKYENMMSLTYSGDCVSFCGAGAELKVSGLEKLSN